jgi:hypothetical protein
MRASPLASWAIDVISSMGRHIPALSTSAESQFGAINQAIEN